MELESKWVVVILLIILAFSFLGAKDAKDVENLLISGNHLRNAQVQYILSADCPWSEFPAWMKEEIATGHGATKLSRQDLRDIKDWYIELIANYKEPVSVLGKSYREKVKKEE